MNKEVNELLDKLEQLENAPLIWVNKKVYDTSKEIERLNNIINEFEKYIRMHHTDEYANKLIKKIKGEDKE